MCIEAFCEQTIRLKSGKISPAAEFFNFVLLFCGFYFDGLGHRDIERAVVVSQGDGPLH